MVFGKSGGLQATRGVCYTQGSSFVQQADLVNLSQQLCRYSVVSVFAQRTSGLAPETCSWTLSHTAPIASRCRAVLKNTDKYEAKAEMAFELFHSGSKGRSRRKLNQCQRAASVNPSGWGFSISFCSRASDAGACERASSVSAGIGASKRVFK